MTNDSKLSQNAPSVGVGVLDPDTAADTRGVTVSPDSETVDGGLAEEIKLDSNCDEIMENCEIVDYRVDCGGGFIDGGGEVYGVEDEVMDDVGVKTQKGPVEPTRAEIEAHEITHIPFRNWCKDCVRGRGRSSPHLNQGERIKEVPGLHFDYWFPRDSPGGPRITVLSMKEDCYKSHLGYVVDKKGRSDDLARKICKDLEDLGFNDGSKVILKSDGENAIGDLMREIKDIRSGASLIEVSPKYESQSNGTAEQGVQAHEGLVRTMKVALEDHIEPKVSVVMPIFTWLVSHVADILSKFSIGNDGRSPYHRIKGKKYGGTMVEFGSCVMYRIPGKVEGGVMAERWKTGIWLGKRRKTDEHWVGLDDGTVDSTRTIRLVKPSERWSAERIFGLKGCPWNRKDGSKVEEEEAPKVIPYTREDFEEMEEAAPKVREREIRDFRDR